MLVKALLVPVGTDWRFLTRPIETGDLIGRKGPAKRSKILFNRSCVRKSTTILPTVDRASNQFKATCVTALPVSSATASRASTTAWLDQLQHNANDPKDLLSTGSEIVD